MFLWFCNVAVGVISSFPGQSLEPQIVVLVYVIYSYILLYFNRWALLKGAATRWQSDGVNSMNFQTLSYKEDALYTLVYVKVNQSDALNVRKQSLSNYADPHF